MAEEHPRLRCELRFLYRERAGAQTVLIEDPMGGSFMETDNDTAAFARLLNGRRTAGEALRQLHADRPGARLSEAEVEPVLDELRRHGLLHGDEAGPPGKAGRRRIGPVSQRLRLGSGSGFFESCARYLGWLYGPFGWMLWAGLITAGAATMIANGSRFYQELGTLFSVDLIVLFWLAWLISKAWHEINHGVVARLYGVEVREYGVLFILFFPLGAYVDVTDAWRLESRWQRFHITAAGIIGELGLGAIAVMLWTRAPEGDWRAFLQSLVVATTVSSLLFNANPLMRYDGYYALTDLTGIANLYQRGAAAVRNMTLRFLTGTASGEKEPAGIVLYGWLALLWRMVVAVTLCVVAAHLAFGFGVVLALMVVWAMVLAPLGKLAQSVWKAGAAPRCKAALRLGFVAAAIAALWFLPVPTWISAPGVVDYRDSIELRAASSGAVVEVAASEGTAITPGDPVVQLVNASLEAERVKLAARQAKTRIELEQARAADDPSTYQSKQDYLETVRQELVEAQMRLDRLAVTAPRAGVIFGGKLRDLEGGWIARGDLIAEIGNMEILEARVWLLPDDATDLVAAPARLTFRQTAFGSHAVPVRLERVEPAAAGELPPAAITAEGGGPLAIDVSGEERRLAVARFASTFVPKGGTEGWYPGAPGRLVSSIIWRPAGTIVIGWFDHIDWRNPAKWAL
ncbi:site-2 protease family protein [Mesorhizobium xinjiangense]|uniref:site-2 protease family protein n=1 Tax=Mesorhizobium xinjiangense TaxID=2678685 RepID=UPI0018DC36BB|nr:site-2 protease family protein [Mesorhizobium xinjiangense]